MIYISYRLRLLILEISVVYGQGQSGIVDQV